MEKALPVIDKLIPSDNDTFGGYGAIFNCIMV